MVQRFFKFIPIFVRPHRICRFAQLPGPPHQGDLAFKQHWSAGATRFPRDPRHVADQCLPNPKINQLAHRLVFEPRPRETRVESGFVSETFRLWPDQGEHAGRLRIAFQ